MRLQLLERYPRQLHKSPFLLEARGTCPGRSRDRARAYRIEIGAKIDDISVAPAPRNRQTRRDLLAGEGLQSLSPVPSTPILLLTITSDDRFPVQRSKAGAHAAPMTR